MVRWIVGGIAFYAVVVAAALLHAWRERALRQLARVYELVLLYYVFFLIGVGGLWNAIGHSVLADDVARSIGWLPGSPFQVELAAAHLGWAVVALSAPWLHRDVAGGAVLSKSVFLLGAAAVHANDIVQRGNMAPGNAGFATLVFGDVIVPVGTLTLLALSRRTPRNG